MGRDPSRFQQKVSMIQESTIEKYLSVFAKLREQYLQNNNSLRYCEIEKIVRENHCAMMRKEDYLPLIVGQKEVTRENILPILQVRDAYIRGTSSRPPVSRRERKLQIKSTSKELTEELAINLLKSKGYKVLKPITEYKEI